MAQYCQLAWNFDVNTHSCKTILLSKTFNISISISTLVFLCLPSPVRAACAISALNIVFGTYPPFSSTPTDFNGSVTVNCSAGSGTVAPSVVLTVGTGEGASYSERRLSFSSNVLGYNLFKDSAHTIVIGDGTSGTQKLTGSSSVPTNGGTETYPVFGRVRPNQQRYDPPGSYSDIINATLTY